MLNKILCVAIVHLLMVGSASAQGNVTLQLPTFRTFYTTGSVLVPDQGSAVVGGRRRASNGHTAFGPSFLPPRRAVGHGVLADQVTVQATVHDFASLDEQTLRAATDLVPKNNAAPRSASDSSAAAPPAGSVMAARAQRDAELAALNAEADRHLQAAKRAESNGKPGLAKVYYQMGLRRAHGALREELIQRLAAVSAPRTRASAKR